MESVLHPLPTLDFLMRVLRIQLKGSARKLLVSHSHLQLKRLFCNDQPCRVLLKLVEVYKVTLHPFTKSNQHSYQQSFFVAGFVERPRRRQ